MMTVGLSSNLENHDSSTPSWLGSAWRRPWLRPYRPPCDWHHGGSMLLLHSAVHRTAKTLHQTFFQWKKLSCTVSPTRSTIDYTLLEHPHSFHLTCFSLFFQHFPTHPQLSECDLPYPRHPSGWQYKACPMQRGAWIWTYLDTVDEMGFTGALLLRKHDETCSCHMFHKFP